MDNTNTMQQQKQYIGIVKDHSVSMNYLSSSAMKDYNSLISSIKNAAKTNNIDTIVSTVKCGIGPGRGKVQREVTNSNVQVLQSITNYPTNGTSTPLFDSVGDLINQFRLVPDYNDFNVSFLILVITDGEDNDSPLWRNRIANEIKDLHKSDRWTFVFRVPKGYKRTLMGFGIPEGNIEEWDQNERSLAQSTQNTDAGIQQYFVARSKGIRSTSTFYSNLSNVSKEEIKQELKPITNEVTIYVNTVSDGIAIKELAEHHIGTYNKGTVFYQLVKREKDVQDYKIICICDKDTGVVYSGTSARDLMGLPRTGTIALTPGDHKNYDIFIQSTSVNRKIPLNSKILVWNNYRNM